MFGSITFTYHFTLAIAPLSFILVGIPCKFDMLPDVNVPLPSEEEEMHSSSRGSRCANLAAHSSKG